MTMKAFIHVGTHKTGSTAIQNYLNENEDEIVNRGYLWPKSGRPSIWGGQHDLAFEIRDKQYMSSSVSPMRELLSEIRSRTHNVLILSSEEFTTASFHNPENFEAFINTFTNLYDEVFIVVYLRNQVDFLISNYFERLKYGFKMPFIDYVMARTKYDLDEYTLDYNKLLSTFDHIPRCSIIAKSYSDVQAGDIVNDFCNIIGPDMYSGGHAQLVNKRLPIHQSLVQFLRNSIGRELSHYELLAVSTIVSDLDDGRFVMRPSLKDFIIDHYYASNDQVMRKHDIVIRYQSPSSHDCYNIDDFFSESVTRYISLLSTRLARIDELNDAHAFAQDLAITRYHQLEELKRLL